MSFGRQAPCPSSGAKVHVVVGAAMMLGALATRPALSQGALRSRPIQNDQSSGELAYPHGVAFSGSSLVVLDRDDRYQVKLLSVPRLATTRTYVRKGQGPSELAIPSFLVPEASGNELWIFDAGTLLWSRWQFADSARQLRTARAPEMLFGATIAGGGELFATGFFRGGRIRRFSPAAVSVASPFSPIPGGGTESEATRQHAWQAYPRLSPDGRHLLVASRHSSRVDVISTDGRGRDTVLFLDDRYRTPVYREADRGGGQLAMQSGADLRFGTIAVAGNTRCVVVLYSGRSRREAPGVANFGRTLVIFDRSLRRVQDLTLSFDASAVDVHAVSGQLAVAEVEPLPRVHLFTDPAVTEICGGKPNGRIGQ
jgi:hypothetical protein